MPHKEANMQKYERKFLECLDLRGVSERTKVDYFRRIKPLEKYYSKDPTTLSIQQIREYFLHLIRVKKLSPATLKSSFFSIRFFYIHTVGLKKENFNFYKPKIEFKLPVVLNREEVKKIISMVRIYDYWILLTLAYQCGLRVSEVVSIKIADIDGELKTITIRNSKGNKDRTVPLPEKLYFQLREYWKTHRNRSLLFPLKHSNTKNFDRENTTKHIPIRTAQKVMSLTRKDAGILKKATFHTLRHSYATHLLEAGVNIKIIQHLLGHNSLRSTMIYLHLTNASQQKSVEIINGLMKDI